MPSPPVVVFVCLHGSAKSVIASEHFRRLSNERGLDVRVVCAGTEPDAEIPPKVVQGLLADGFDVRGQRPRAIARADLERASHVVAFACDLGDVAPAGLRVERWDEVPAVSEDYGRARDAIATRVRALVDQLLVAQ
jgi:arsenate reductase (thioredoxin)